MSEDHSSDHGVYEVPVQVVCGVSGVDRIIESQLEIVSTELQRLRSLSSSQNAIIDLLESKRSHRLNLISELQVALEEEWKTHDSITTTLHAITANLAKLNSYQISSLRSEVVTKSLTVENSELLSELSGPSGHVSQPRNDNDEEKDNFNSIQNSKSEVRKRKVSSEDSEKMNPKTSKWKHSRTATAGTGQDPATATSTAPSACPLKLPDKSKITSSVEMSTTNELSRDLLQTLQGHTEGVFDLVEMESGELVSCSQDQSLRLWNWHSGECLREVKKAHTQGICCMTLLPSGYCVTGSDDRSVRIWDLYSVLKPGVGKTKKSVHLRSVFSITVVTLPSGTPVLASGSCDGAIKVWELATYTLLHHIQTGSVDVASLATLPDGCLASGTGDGVIRIWELSTPGGPKCTTQDPADIKQHHQSCVCSLLYLTCGRLVSGSAGPRATMKMWPILPVLPTLAKKIVHEKCEREFAWPNAESDVCCLAETSRGDILSGSVDFTVRLWDPATGGCLRVVGRHDGYVYKVRALLAGEVASCSKDGTVKIWRLY